MKKFSIIIILFLTCLWFYICWYWYTCQIKGFCYVEKIDGQIALDTSEVLEDSPLPIEEDILQESSPSETENQEDTIAAMAEEDSSTEEKIPDTPTQEEVSLEKQACEDILTQAISLGGNNSEEEVSNLETFLNTKEGEALDVDGRYSQDDFDAVKRFQLKYRADVLDPSGIANPTGYVFTNTIKKINELNCE